MKPGRELDELIATHVMNWPSTMHSLSRPVPYYSTDIAAAFTVDKPGWLWEFQESTQALTVVLYSSLEVKRKAMRDFPIFPKDGIMVRRAWLDDKAQTYAWLRCLAALRVEVGHD